MISQLFATIMMALGVASGTKATSNTFYDAEKPQPKHAVNNIDDSTTIEYTGSSYVYQVNDNSIIEHRVKKYYINENNNPNYYLSYLNIYNTIYTEHATQNANPNYRNWDITYTLLQINNYFNSSLRFKIAVNEITTRQTGINITESIYQVNDSLNQYIDATLNSTLVDSIETYVNNNQSNRIYNYTHSATNTGTYQVETQTPYLTIDPNETIYILIRQLVIYDITSGAYAEEQLPQTFNINGQITTPDYNVEVVDIPGVMYTILTMPFSFISTAFNLTIFPGTPYQLNFGNLFLTILAIFILLWLIKKVFH